jgi:imidazole glycerol-phosphate synthase subunit HisF
MMLPRIIPCLLLKDKYLHKTIRFNKPVYIGDPINAIKILNDKQVDELIFLDIDASSKKKAPNLEIIANIASECFMPVCYGGGIKNIQDIRTILNLGIEKISISSQAVENPNFIKEASSIFGSQSITVCIDVKKNFFGEYEVVILNAKKKTHWIPLDFALKMEEMGAGEILINSVDRDGTMKGYDISLVKTISSALQIPVVACGGAGSMNHIVQVLKEGKVSSAAAGSLFVFYGSSKGVLINYPDEEELKLLYNEVEYESIHNDS